MARNAWLMETDGGQAKSKPATFGKFQLLQQKQTQQSKPATFGEFQVLQQKQKQQKSAPIPPLPAQVKARHAQTTQPTSAPTSAPRVSGIVPQTTHSVAQPVKTAPVAPQETSIQDMIQQMVDAKKTEEVPHYHPDLTPMNEDEMTEPIV